MPKVRSLVFMAFAAIAASAAWISHPVAVAAIEADGTPTATLDGKPIPLTDVARYYCDDFAYPEIRCSSSKLVVDVRATLTSLLTGNDYVTIWDIAGYQGPFMNVSQDYGMLATLGWNDKVSSFKARNSATGKFWTDWFFGGSSYSFCCNSQVPSLGSFDNTFSAVQRT